MSQLLNQDVLGRLERELRSQGAPLTAYLRAGVPEPDASRVAERVGLRLPAEARRWFAWHDGVSDAEWPPEAAFGGLHLLDLAAAAEGYIERRKIALDNAPTPELAETEWSERWLPLAVLFGGRDVAIDCGGADDGPVPVYFVDWWDSDVAAPAYGSIGALIEACVDALAQRIWRWDIEGRCWEIDGDRLGDSRAAELLRG